MNTSCHRLVSFLFLLLLLAGFSPAFGQDLAGCWDVNFNGYKGKAEFSLSGGQWTGRTNVDTTWETLSAIGSSAGGEVTFTRGRVNQVYTGRLTGNSMSGKFSGGYSWSAQRCDSASTTPPPKDTPPTSSAMTLRADTRRVKAGETVTVPIWLDNGAGVANMNFDLRYSSQVATATAVAKGSVIPSNFLFEKNPNSAGVVRIGFAGSRDLAGSAPVAQVTFKAVGRPGQSTPLRLVVTTVSGADDGRPAILTIDGKLVIIASKDQVPGDFDGDGRLTANDALNALRMSVGLIPENLVCDMDSDRQVTSTDARLILKMAVGK